jgi:hypothetical protein
MSDTFSTGTRTAFARAVAAEVRAQLAARQITYKQLVDGAGLSSTNYLSIRLRDVKPFDLDDIDKIAHFLSDGLAGSETQHFIRHAVDEHEERIWSDAPRATVETDDRPLLPRGVNVAQGNVDR